MLNATQMARPYGKRPAEWLRLPSTISFLGALSEVGLSHNADTLVVTRKGGLDPYQGGTWLHINAAIIMVNATQMAKPYGKLPNEWLRLTSTLSFLEALEDTTGFPRSLVETKEGRNGGTWLYELAAI